MGAFQGCFGTKHASEITDGNTCTSDENTLPAALDAISILDLDRERLKQRWGRAVSRVLPSTLFC